MRKSPLLRYFLDAVNVAAVAVMVAVLFEMGKETLFNTDTAPWTFEWRSTLIAVLAFVMVFVLKKSNPLWLVAGGSILGYLLFLV
jgi:chromate transporter